MNRQQDEANVKQQDAANGRQENSGHKQTVLDKARAQRDEEKQAAVVGKGLTAGQRKAK
jgi:hypothetical protein